MGRWAGCRSSSIEPCVDRDEEGERVRRPRPEVRERNGGFENLAGGHLGAASGDGVQVPSVPRS